MEIIDPGHTYNLQVYDGDRDGIAHHLVFMKREGAGYPGNVGHYPGTNLQEVIRACIDRSEYLYNQIPCAETAEVIENLRKCLMLLEQRTRIRRNQPSLPRLPYPEDMPTCKTCGHILCLDHQGGNGEIHASTHS